MHGKRQTAFGHKKKHYRRQIVVASRKLLLKLRPQSCYIMAFGHMSSSPSNHTQPPSSIFVILHSIMGGCVSGPKDVALKEGEEAPVVENPTTPNAEGEIVVAQENKQEDGEKKEDAVVDLIEAKDEKVEEAKAEVVAAETKEPEKEVEAEQPKAEETPVTL
ncbi:hypothetical protein VNO78_01878 [Psophocarpus tetragonolobus]|uniref:Uncharacterized protein n=1 Tax=Psophocarpus tetragonolobus TaxID=3891 RepID=A0AAN9T211_PSOTE